MFSSQDDAASFDYLHYTCFEFQVYLVSLVKLYLTEDFPNREVDLQRAA